MAGGAANNFGLFGFIEAATLKNMVLTNFSLNANGFSNIGTLVGLLTWSKDLQLLNSQRL